MKKILLVFITSLLSFASSYANIPVLTKSFIHLEGQQELQSYPTLSSINSDRSELIKKAAIAASASYNDHRLVEIKSASKRGKTESEKELNSAKTRAMRELMFANGEEIITFNATLKRSWLGLVKDVAEGSMPAGIVSISFPKKGNAQITVAFHGTECDRDLLTDANGLRSNSDLLTKGLLSWLPFTSSTVHTGFNNRYMDSREALLDIIDALFQMYDLNENNVDIIVTGHSLGGALATLAAVDIKKQFMDSGRGKLFLITFSSPRVVNAAGADEIETLIGRNRILRIWRGNDPVTAIVLGSAGYKHVGVSIKLESKSSVLSMENHKMDSILSDAISQENTKFIIDDAGIKGSMYNTAKSMMSSINPFNWF